MVRPGPAPTDPAATASGGDRALIPASTASGYVDLLICSLLRWSLLPRPLDGECWSLLPRLVQTLNGTLLRWSLLLRTLGPSMLAQLLEQSMLPRPLGRSLVPRPFVAVGHPVVLDPLMVALDGQE